MPIRVELELTSGDFETGVARATQTLQRLENQAHGTIQSITKIETQSRSFLTTLRDVTLTLGVAGAAFENLHKATTGWAEKIVELNADVERMSALLKAMSTSANPVKEASDYIKNLREEAKQAPFSLQAMHQAFIRMKSGGLDPAAGSMKALTDAVAAFGGTDETLGRASLAFQEMAGKGVVQMKELRNQLGMAVPQAMKMLARSVGVTYEQLMSDVHTGTVNAKQAIEALNLEFERVYGGAAVRQMDTFNGQLARMKVIMMDLAIKAGGADDDKNGFFGTVKQQFKEFNDMMTGSVGEQLAGKVGEGLTEVVKSIRKLIDGAIEMRSTLISVIEAVAMGFGGAAVINTFAGFASAIKTARTELGLLSAQWTIAMRGVAAANAAAGVANMTSLAGAMTSAGNAARFLGAAIPVIGAGLMTVAPYLPLIAGGLALAADYFGLFQNKARDAWKEMEQFGAHSMKQIEQGQEYVKHLEKQVKYLEELQKIYGHWGRASDGNLAKAQSELDAAKDQLSGFKKTALKEEGRKAAGAIMDDVEEAQAALQRQYAKREDDAADRFTKEVRETVDRGHSIALIRKRYQEEEAQRHQQAYDEQIAMLESHNRKLEERLRNGTEIEKAAAQTAMDAIRKKIEEQKRFRDQDAAIAMGTPKGKKPIDDEKLMAKGEAFLEKLNAQIEGDKAGLQGLDHDVYELQRKLADLKFGDPMIESVQNLNQQILEAKQTADDLHKILTGQQHLDRDLLNTEIKLQQQLIDEQTRGMSDADKLRVKIQQGFYEGYGGANNPMQARLIDLRIKMQGVGVSAQETGDILKNSTFGTETTNAAKGYLDIVVGIAGAFTRLKGAAEGASLSKTFDASGTPFFASGQQPTGSFVDKVVQAESGGNANARSGTSSAAGAAQFIESTWIDFIRSMHSELLPLGKDALLKMRDNPDMSREATGWLASKNALYLNRLGIQTNDANLYAAHFLGANAAGKVLTSDDRTALAAIPAIAKIISSNHFLGDMTVRDFKNFTNKKMGRGVSWAGGKDPGIEARYEDDSKLGRPDNITDAQNERLKNVDRLTQQLNETKAKNNIADKARELAEQIEQANLVAEGNNKRLAALRKLIEDGKIDSSDKNPESARYKELIRLAKELDVTEKKRDDAKKARTAAEGARQSLDRAKLDQQTTYDLAKTSGDGITNPKMSEAYVRMVKQLDDYVAKTKDAYGQDSEEFRKAQADKEQILAQSLNSEVQKNIQALSKKTLDLKRSLMTADEAREDEYQKEMRRIDNLLAHFTGSEQDKAALVKKMEDYKAAYAESKGANDPIYKQFKDWGDAADNFKKTASGAIGTLADNLAGALTGARANWAGFFQSLSKEMMKLVLQWSMSTIGKMILPGGGAKLSSGGSAKLGGGLSSLISVAHTGGLVGGSLAYRSASMSLFAGAPRFHTGGVIGADEVPIIAKKGEGVFTPQQMAALGGGMGGNQVAVHMPISVQTSGGGSPQQNADLAAQIGKQVEQAARNTVISEISRQMRPGNLLASRYQRA